MPMRFSWVACQPICRGWVSAVGIVTQIPPRISKSSPGRQTRRRNHLLDSSGGSVNDPSRSGGRRNLGALDHRRQQHPDPHRARRSCERRAEAYCESMCVFLLLSGKTRYVPEARMSGYIRFGWVTAPTTPRPPATPAQDLK